MAWYPCGCVPVDECRLINTPGCVDDASIYIITVSGLTNDSCADCAAWNGTFNLKYVSGGVWKSDPSDSTSCGHSAGDPLWKLEHDSTTGYYYLTAVGLAYRWRTAIASWTCNGTDTMTLVSPSPIPAPCSNVPSTIDAVPCTIECEYCSTDDPDSISVRLLGFVDHSTTGCWCSLLNGYHVLNRRHPCRWWTEGTFECRHGVTANYSISVWIAPQSVGGSVCVFCMVTIGTTPAISYWGSPAVLGAKYDSGSTAAIDCSATYHLTPYSLANLGIYCGVFLVPQVSVIF